MWKWPVVAAVVVLSVVMALMVFVMMVSLKQQTWLLGEMVAINSQLADTTHNLEVQKAQHEAMLVGVAGVGGGGSVGQEGAETAGEGCGG